MNTAAVMVNSGTPMRLPAMSFGDLTNLRLMKMKLWRNTRDANTGIATNGFCPPTKREMNSELENSEEARALRYAFFAERDKVHDRAHAAADQALDLDRAAGLLAGRCLAPRSLVRCARQHAVFGRDPAAALALEPRRQTLFERRRHQHMGVAEFDHAGTLGIFDHAAFQRHGAQFIRRTAAWPHENLQINQ